MNFWPLFMICFSISGLHEEAGDVNKLPGSIPVRRAVVGFGRAKDGQDFGPLLDTGSVNCGAVMVRTVANLVGDYPLY